MLSRIFKPNYLYDLLRIGSKNDGGYLVERQSLEKTEFLLSFGISTNWDFEEDFIKFKNIGFIAFDGSIDKNFWINQKKIAIKKSLKLSFKKLIDYYFLQKRFKSFFNTNNLKVNYISNTLNNSMTLDQVFQLTKSNHNFLKIDIEGSEYKILNDILRYQKRITGIAIEFHNCRLNLNKISNFIKCFSLELVNIHANNYDLDYKKNIPNTLEITFARNPVGIAEFKNLPHNLDNPNRLKSPEINLEFNE
tara:strand:- start:1807 stop:2553 length:747 start_codon:yes stop_codon:yes gene_type:complete